jgi:hypothetical protein
MDVTDQFSRLGRFTPGLAPRKGLDKSQFGLDALEGDVFLFRDTQTNKMHGIVP